MDFPAWRRLLQHQLDGGVGAVVVAGSTGEAQALEDDEYDALLRQAVEQAAGRMAVLAGTGLANTAKTLALTRRAAALGADAALVVTPPYVRPTQAGLLAHYRTVADASPVPLLLYNVPGRTGCDMQPETVAALAGHGNILGIKEAVAEPARLRALLALQKDGFALFSGDDPTCCQALCDGAAGVVSVASNVLPATFVKLARLARGDAGDKARAQRLDAELAPVHAFLALEPNPIPVKALLQHLGIGQAPRLPLLPLSAPHHSRLPGVAAAILALEHQCRLAA